MYDIVRETSDIRHVCQVRCSTDYDGSYTLCFSRIGLALLHRRHVLKPAGLICPSKARETLEISDILDLPRVDIPDLPRPVTHASLAFIASLLGLINRFIPL
eukprot:scaffold9768_cov151-Cylindrotheca_fusiformis.AAC.1